MMTHFQITPDVSVLRLLKMNSPEWHWLTVGLLACSMTGAISPIFAFFYGEVFSVSIQRL